MKETPAIVVPITDVLDLHWFKPKEVESLLDSYFEACVEKGIFSVRVVHGKGTGALQRHVHVILQRHPLVIAFKTAPESAGGWGATLIQLAAPDKF
jgi:DNA-nicking Smr family endonuclease